MGTPLFMLLLEYLTANMLSTEQRSRMKIGRMVNPLLSRPHNACRIHKFRTAPLVANEIQMSDGEHFPVMLTICHWLKPGRSLRPSYNKEKA